MEMILIKILFEQAQKYGLPGAMKSKVDNMVTFNNSWRIKYENAEYTLFNLDLKESVTFAENAIKFDPKKKKIVEQFTKDVFNIYTPTEDDADTKTEEPKEQ